MPLTEEAKELLLAATRSAVDALATDAVAVDVSGVSPFNDAFLIVTADNPRHLRAVRRAVEDDLSEQLQLSPLNVEGDETSDWLLLNYGDVAVHAFLPESREYYALERLWGARPRLDLSAALVRSSGPTDSRP